MTAYQPIPIPWRTRWRQIRVRILPVIAFLLALALVAYLWEQELAPSSMQGEVYASSSEISAPVSGSLDSLLVRPFDRVEAGQVIAYIRPVPPSQVAASLAVLKAEVELARLGSSGPMPDLQRNLHNQRSLQQDWLEARARLASLRVRMFQAEREYNRLKGLRSNENVSESVFDAAKSEYEALRAEESELREMVSALESFVNEANVSSGSSEDAFEATIRWQKARLRQLETQLEPFPVIAPIDGTVTVVSPESGTRAPSEGVYVREGETILRVLSNMPEYIIGYARIPVIRQPDEGLSIQVLQRGGRRQSATSEVISVGSQYEALGPVFRRQFGEQEQRALPFVVRIPTELDLRPGEIVDLYLR